MAYVMWGQDYCLACGETVLTGQDCSLRCRLVMITGEELHFAQELPAQGLLPSRPPRPIPAPPRPQRGGNRASERGTRQEGAGQIRDWLS